MTMPTSQSVYHVFKAIQSDPTLRRRMVAATNGAELENYFKDEMSKRGFNRVMPDGLTQTEKPAYDGLRNRVKDTSTPLVNPILRLSAHYIEQPNGSQDYPDFMVFERTHIWAIEPKHRSGNGGHPMWNSGTPRKHGIYLFGNRQDVTFFLGGDVLTDEQVEAIRQYRLQTRNLRDATNQGSLAGQEYGFSVYDRFMLQQQRTNSPGAVLDFFTNPRRAQLENRVLAMLLGPTTPPER